MTRINVVPVEELSNEHLLGENTRSPGCTTLHYQPSVGGSSSSTVLLSTTTTLCTFSPILGKSPGLTSADFSADLPDSYVRC